MRSKGVAIAASNTVQIQKTRFTVGTRRGRSTARWKRRLKREKAGEENGREKDESLNFEARRKRPLLLHFSIVSRLLTLNLFL